MPGRDLKHHEDYLRRLRAFARGMQITVKFAEEDGDGSYDSFRRTITIDPDLSDSYEIAILLHELGHAIDDMLMKRGLQASLQKAYGGIYDKKPKLPAHKALVMKCERRAWLYARYIGKQLRIELGKWFDEARKDCLSSYQTQ